ncbi:N-acyl-D-amino-acid deacylase [Sanguibacter gelidistatuariae]|uniref:N-acyl-D-amino-acid deacylase n=1 Tax=Sanguibacter gelidistatuariae TaxID=1814289 RepID=A0A1G6QLN9_9MICO|nr:amidohydrolase family protein [Sanguibacter gelidistatuariae]SDC92587.1 N-acyl-D-amino-acid deacylase [Sanguibacter gelidistatuariae]
MTIIHGARLPDAHSADGLSHPVDLHLSDTVVSVTQSGARPTGDGHVIDADGRIAFPGFIDSHVHGEAAVLDTDVQHAMLRQGVTSIVVGQDGVSYAPSARAAGGPAMPDAGAGAPGAFAWATGYFSAINGEHPTFRGGSVAELLATYDRTTPLNVAYLVPHGTLRYGALGDAARPATPGEIAAMADALIRGLDEGACGMSTGLEYVPASYAERQELLALTAVLAGRGLPHVSHMRGYEEKAGAAMAELMDLARETDVATHVSHYHGPAAELAGYVDAALAEGLDVTFDSYPYLRGCSILSMVSLPTWLPIADPARTVQLLRDESVLARLHTEHFPALADLWGRVTMAAVPGELNWTEGMTLPDVAARLGLSPADAAVELLVSTGLRAGCVFAQPPTNSPESVRTLLRHGAHMGGSDAIYAGGRPHPRGWGAFARFLSEHVRDLGDWTWADAQDHLSTAAARRFGFTDRGQLLPGMAADVVLVDPDRVRDEATYENPRQLASGIDDVLVAGVPVLVGGAMTGLLPGRALRPGGSRPAAPTAVRTEGGVRS